MDLFDTCCPKYPFFLAVGIICPFHPEKELSKVLNFLKVGISDVSMRCAIDRKNGIHHRSKDKTIQFPIYREG